MNRSAHHKNKHISIKQSDEKQRLCLRCMREFLSDHIGNRMCKPCVKAGEGLPRWQRQNEI